MRRADREITDKQELLQMIEQCGVCRLAMADTPAPYIVPLNFGVKAADGNLYLYFHCSNQGKKLDLLRSNPYASFELDCGHNFIRGETPCSSTMEFASVCGNGIVEVLPEQEKAAGLDIIMAHYTGETAFAYAPETLRATTVLRLTVQDITGKRLKK